VIVAVHVLNDVTQRSRLIDCLGGRCLQPFAVNNVARIIANLLEHRIALPDTADSLSPDSNRAVPCMSLLFPGRSANVLRASSEGAATAHVVTQVSRYSPAVHIPTARGRPTSAGEID